MEERVADFAVDDLGAGAMTAAITCSLLLTATANDRAQAPVGTYKPDFSHAPKNSRGQLRAYFGPSYLVIRADGSFALCGMEQKGFWRREKHRFILNYDGFFHLQAPALPETIRAQTPTSHLEGMILRPGQGNSMVLRDWGSARGPVIFRPMPRRTVAELIRTSDGDDGRAIEAYEVLATRRESDWSQFLSFVADEREPAMIRSWAALTLRGVKKPEAIEAAARLIPNIRPIAKGREETVRNVLAEVVAAHPTESAVSRLAESQEKGLIAASVVAKAIAKLKDPKHIPFLLQWLGSSRKWDRIESLEALTVLDAAEALPPARKATEDADEMVQIKAYGLIARLSPDSAERKAALRKIAGWIKSPEFLLPFDAVDALCASNHPDALPYLAAIMVSDLPALNRRNTATALGKLGDLRAIPVLLEAKKMRPTDDIWGESEVCRAAIEALAALGKLKRSTP